MKISIAMCTFNGARFLNEQCASFRRQTRLPDELVICDDQSTDETQAILEAFAVEAPFPVRLRVNQYRLGTSRNFSRAIGLCNGDLIFLSDQDDVWREDKLLRFEKAFDDSPATGLIFCDALLIDEETEPTGKHLWESVKFNSEVRKKFAAGHQFQTLLKRNYITGTTMAFRQGFSDLVCPVPVTMRIVHDSWIGLLMSLVSRIEFIDDTLVMYRIHAGQQVGLMRGRSSVMPSSNQYDEDDEELSFPLLLHKILSANETLLGSPELESFSEKIDHHCIRARMVKKTDNLYSRLELVIAVFNELVHGRYHRYSSGFLSAARDMKEILGR
ncbi:MAG: glycosyltransferase family 2 protein [Pyrinomonadaceae bacterium]